MAQSASLKLGILNTLVLEGETVLAKEPMPVHFQRLFAAVDAPFIYQTYEVTQGELPLDLDECGAYLITGSLQGVYDSHPWIANLTRFIQEAYRAGKKLVGICLGHQIIAHALGGWTEKSEKGWGLGRRQFAIDVQKSWMNPNLSQCSLYFAHQDQVTKLPPGAERLGGDAFCPNSLFAMGNQVLGNQVLGNQVLGNQVLGNQVLGNQALGNQVLGIQGHPEFTPGFMTAVVDSLQAKIPKEVYETAVASLQNGRTDALIVAGWIRDFLLS